VDFALVLVSHALNTAADADGNEHYEHSDASTFDSVHSEADAVDSSVFFAIDNSFDLFTDDLSAFGTANAVVWCDTFAKRAAFQPKTDWLVAFCLAFEALPAFFT